MKHQTNFTKDPGAKQLHVTHAFDAPVENVWQAWTKAAILDKWWAPRPWKSETKSLDFKPGGLWHYSMVGPNGDRSWCCVEFEAIDPQHSFKATSRFCDENAIPNNTMPLMHWHTEFSTTATSSKINVTISFDKESDLKTIVEMGFETGFSMGLGNLDELLEESAAA